MDPGRLTAMESFTKFLTRCRKRLGKHLNFYRIHLLFFTFTPIIASIIFYLSSGRYKVSYIDSLFNCVSAMTVCGLATINLSELTPFQQSILFLLMCIGNPIAVSWVMVIVRRHHFDTKLENVVQSHRMGRTASVICIPPQQPLLKRLVRRFVEEKDITLDEEAVEIKPVKPVKLTKLAKSVKPLKPTKSAKSVSTDMIRRTNETPVRVNPSGVLSPGSSERKPSDLTPISTEGSTPSYPPDTEEQGPQPQVTDITDAHFTEYRRRVSDASLSSRHPIPTSAPVPKNLQRTQTVEFAPSPPRRSLRATELTQIGAPQQTIDHPEHHEHGGVMRQRRGSTTGSTHTTTSSHTPAQSRPARERGFGGFPSPWSAIVALTRRYPKIHDTFSRTLTIPATTSLVPGLHTDDPNSKAAPYLTFQTTVGRNSTFPNLTMLQLVEVGGVEYGALNVLMWLVPLYHFGFQIFAFIVFSAYTAQPRWASVFNSENQTRPVNSVWFSAYQVVSAYTNTGTSLVDQSMLPFQRAYPMILIMALLILAGNTCFPIFLRFFIWILSKSVTQHSYLHKTLVFLLEHPRRCFIYLFPSHQTWFLFSIVILLTAIDWIAFIVLDFHNKVIEMIPLGVRIIAGFLQGISVRAAGFGIVPLAAMAPAVKVLYVIMMYISVYPVAMSVRSTNVYEEQSLGVYHPDKEDIDKGFTPHGDRLKVWSQYLALHARQQLAFDMWWIALFVFLICCAEAAEIDDPANATWLNVFTILFELVSAYGTVGLSLGIPTENYSLSGAFKPFSKLVVCVVMLRGRHRGLPMSIDRAILLPEEYRRAQTAIRQHGDTSNPLLRYSETILPQSDPRRWQGELYRVEETNASSEDGQEHQNDSNEVQA